MENILILGFGITGKSAYKALESKYNIYVQDDNLDDILKNSEEKYDLRPIKNKEDILKISPLFVVKSPGINPANEYVSFIKENNIEIFSDLELAFRLYKGRTIIAITGTNGKTTTTSLVGKIISDSGKKVHIIGNIGKGILEAFARGSKDDIYLIEVSSFQLEDTIDFRPNIGAFLNFSPDHLDWHGSEEDYFKAKTKLFANMTEDDCLIMNRDAKSLEKVFNKADIFFSRKEKADYWLNGDQIEGPEGKILALEDIKIPGPHNLENVLAAVSITSELGIGKDQIRKSVRDFKGVSHRLEFIADIGGVSYYNDSKGTNVDSTIKALESFDSGIILIAGGYDKKVSFDELFKAGEKRIKKLILLGQTKEILASEAKKRHMPYEFVDTIEEAVVLANRLAQKGDTVLLSPACASWGMYNNFEERGNDFKKNVLKLVV